MSGPGNTIREEEKEAIIQMSGVSIASLSNPSLRVLRNVNWEVQTGDFWVLAGLQGTGKTDLLMTAAGLMPHAEGQHLLFGEEMPIFDEERMPTRLRAGMVFDGGQLFNHLTILENVALPLLYHRGKSIAAANKRAGELLEGMDLSWAAEETPGALGRNWRKRAGLARALALDPEMLLVDSPLAGLDLKHVSWWLQFLDALSRGHPLVKSRPVTLVVSAADLRPWKALARQFAVLRDHELVGLGTWKQLETASSQLVREYLDYELTHQAGPEPGAPGEGPPENG
jgi:ABC-type transporter Mla maintaining outer membrane lipid asymmetry ATPase subunit MlaF